MYASIVSVDYATVGHVTVDVLSDGSRRPGGSAFYSALQAARLGLRALILTRGVRREIEQLLEPFLDELELCVIDAEQTTTLQTELAGDHLVQRMLAWAGPIAGAEVRLDAAILHIAPVARETPTNWPGKAGFVGLTPQGLVREWSEEDDRVVSRSLERSLLPERCDAFVLSASEREHCAILLGEADGSPRAHDALVVVTAAGAPIELTLAGGAIVRAPVPAVAHVRDQIGAGDVFAAALFVALAEGAAPLAAVSFASAAAAMRITGVGPAAIGDRLAIERRIALAG